MNFVNKPLDRQTYPAPSVTTDDPSVRPARMTLRHMLPLIGFVVPTVIIAYGVVIPRSCIAGINEHTIGFGTTILGACITYIAGVRSALRERR